MSCFNLRNFLILSSILFIYIQLRKLYRTHKLKNQKTFNNNTIVLITGGCLGIGKEMIKMLIESYKCIIINIDIRESEFSELNKIAEENNSKLYNYYCDLSDKEEIENVFNQINEKFEKIDVLINNAGIAFNKKFNDLTDKMMTKTIEINLIAPMILCKKAIIKAGDNKNLHIVNISSIMSQIIATNSCDYISSKWGLFAFHESLRHGKII
jgi:short-subunit dehydrogenase